MTGIKGDRLYVKLGPSQVRRRLKGVGFGVRKVESAGRGEAVIIHTATGQHLRELQAIFHDVLERDKPERSVSAPEQLVATSKFLLPPGVRRRPSPRSPTSDEDKETNA